MKIQKKYKAIWDILLYDKRNISNNHRVIEKIDVELSTYTLFPKIHIHNIRITLYSNLKN